MSTQISFDPDQLLNRHGDLLYRLALLVTLDVREAEVMVIKSVDHFPSTSAHIDDMMALMASFVTTLPPERPKRRWSLRRRKSRLVLPDQTLLSVLMSLSRSQRLVLCMSTIAHIPLTDIVTLLQHETLDPHEALRQSLRVLAPLVTSDHTENAQLDALFGDEVSGEAECQRIRQIVSLGIESTVTHAEIRGHLAVCDACRTISHTLRAIREAVEHRLYTLSRTIQLPEDVEERILAAATPTSGSPRASFLSAIRSRRALVPATAFVIVLIIVFPRPDNLQLASAPANSGVTQPHDLVERALETLYLPPSGEGVWHGRWEIRWQFDESSYATLHADMWYEQGGPRQLLQLTHHRGGGPFEYQLADHAGDFWYAVSERYAPTIYPEELISEDNLRFTTDIDQNERQRLFDARLESGAWGIARDYLRQAQQAEALRSWGRQQTVEGQTIDIVGFDGFSPLGLPPDAIGPTENVATILLSIDAESGNLVEVQELRGAPDQTRTMRTTWRFIESEWLTEPRDTIEAFNLRRAWSDRRLFHPRVSITEPSMLLLERDMIRSPADKVISSQRNWLPAALPSGTDSAVVITIQEPSDFSSLVSGVLYMGPDRWLTIRNLSGDDWNFAPDDEQAEELLVDNLSVHITPRVGQEYQIQVFSFVDDFGDGPLSSVLISAHGYSKDELLATVRSLGPFTVEAYLNQAKAFKSHQWYDPVTFDILLDLVRPSETLPPDMVHHLMLQSFSRQADFAELPDPYHRLPYNGQPEEVYREIWSRYDDNNSEEKTKVADAGGEVYSETYQSAQSEWSHNKVSDYLSISSRDGWSSWYDQFSWSDIQILRIIGCGGAQLETLPDGSRVIVRIEQNWWEGSCMEPSYPERYISQRTQRFSDTARWYESPYIADLANPSLISLIYLDENDQLERLEVRLGDSIEQSVLLTSLEAVVDEIIPLAQVPDGVFDSTPPDAALVIDSTKFSGESLVTLDLRSALQFMTTPMFGLPEGDGIVLTSYEANIGDPSMLSEKVLERAVLDGVVLRASYIVNREYFTVYMGAADAFGAYLRSKAYWVESKPVQVIIDGRIINAWEVKEQNGHDWVFAEVDGTLLGIQVDHQAQRNVIPLLERIDE